MSSGAIRAASIRAWVDASALRLRLATLLLAAGAAAAAGAVPLQVELPCRTEGSCAPRGALRLESVADRSIVHRVPLEGASATIDVPPSTEWEVSLEADRHWALPQRVTIPAEGAARATMPVWRTGRVRAVVKSSDGGLTALRAMASSPPDVRREPEIPRGTAFPCTREEGDAWTCEVPATTLDLSLRAEGLAPHYMWDAKIAPRGVSNLGAVTLKKGASIIAWLDRDTARRLPRPPRAVLRHQTMPDVSPAAARLAVPVAEATFTKRGVVQLAPLPAGRYVLETLAEGYAPSRIAVELHEGHESTFRRPIELAPAASVRLRLSPPVGPGGDPWRVELWRKVEYGSGWEPAASGAVSPEGVFDAANQAEGRVRVTVTDALRNVFANRELTIVAGGGEQSLDLDVVAVKGRVKLGDEALPSAVLLFGGTGGPEKVKSTSDAEGRFRTALPRSGKWLVNIEAAAAAVSAEAEVTVGEDSDEVEIRLPASEVSGWVTDASGARAKADVVILSRAGPLRRTTEQDGTFRFRGISSGTARIRAVHPGSGEYSNVTELSVPEEGMLEGVHLRLESLSRMTGSVLSGGTPVVGARVHGYGFSGGAAQQEKATTDLDGRFALEIPASAESVVLVVAAHGRTLQVFSAPGGGQPAVLDLSPRGGELRLQWPAGAKRLRVLFNGVFAPMPDYLNWARTQGAAVEAGAATIPGVAAGAYQFCADDVCRDGTLAVGGRLTLDVTTPAPDAE